MLRAVLWMRVRYRCPTEQKRGQEYPPGLRYSRNGASIVTKLRLRCVKERTQNSLTIWRAFGIVGNIHSNSSSATPWGGTAMTPRIHLALGPRLMNVGDDSDSSIAADSPGEWWVRNKEIRRCLHSRSRRERSHLFCTATVARRVIESGWQPSCWRRESISEVRRWSVQIS